MGKEAKRKIIVIAVAVAMGMLLTACGAPAASAKTEQPSAAVAASPEANGKAETKTDAPVLPKFETFGFDESQINDDCHIFFFNDSEDGQICFLYAEEDGVKYTDDLVYNFGDREKIGEDYFRENPPAVIYWLFLDKKCIASSDFYFELDGLEYLSEPKDMHILAVSPEGNVLGVAYLPDLLYYFREQERIADFSERNPDVQSLFVHIGSGEELSELAGLTKLRNLQIQARHDGTGDAVLDLSALENFSLLEELFITCSYPVDAAQLRPLTGLKHLVIVWTSIQNIAAIRDLRGLESLSLMDDGMENLDFINGLDRLKSLSLTYCDSLTDVSALKGHDALESLSITDCLNVTDIRAVAGLDNLVVLNLYNCCIESVTPIGSLDRLRCLMLYVGDLQDQDLNALSALTDLRYLCLAGVQEAELDFLSELKNLQVLD